jgi:hypothetical protein
LPALSSLGFVVGARGHHAEGLGPLRICQDPASDLVVIHRNLVLLVVVLLDRVRFHVPHDAGILIVSIVFSTALRRATIPIIVRVARKGPRSCHRHGARPRRRERCGCALCFLLMSAPHVVVPSYFFFFVGRALCATSVLRYRLRAEGRRPGQPFRLSVVGVVVHRTFRFDRGRGLLGGTEEGRVARYGPGPGSSGPCDPHEKCTRTRMVEAESVGNARFCSLASEPSKS